jgi:hypothetical protein
LSIVLHIVPLKKVFLIVNNKGLHQEVSRVMKKKKKEDGKEVSRRDFVKKLAYVAPIIATLVIPKYAVAQTTCPTVCPPRCDGRCPTVCPAFCKHE